MRIEQLEYLAAVVRHGSLRRASEQLHLSQQALSEALAKLEVELGLPLLDRQRSGTRISRHGLELLQPMQDVLDAVDRLRLEAGQERRAARSLRIGTVNAATASVVVPAVRAFTAQQPDVSVEVLPMRQTEIWQGLSEGALELGIVNTLAGDEPPPGLVSRELLRGRPVVVLRADDPLAARTAIEVDELRDSRFIAMRTGYVMHRVMDRLFGGRLPAGHLTTDGAELAKSMVAGGLGITVLPDYSVAADPLLDAGVIVTRPFARDRTTVSLALQHRRVERLPELLAALIRALVDATKYSLL